MIDDMRERSMLQTAEIFALREALKPFADEGKKLPADFPDHLLYTRVFTGAQLRAATLAMGPELLDDDGKAFLMGLAAIIVLPEAEAYRNVLQSIASYTTDSNIKHQVNQVVGCSDEDEALITSAITAGQPISFEYVNHRGERAKRTVMPRRIHFGSTEWHPEPQTLLTALDIEKDAERDFALRDAWGFSSA